MSTDISEIITFLQIPTPQSWIDRALKYRDNV